MANYFDDIDAAAGLVASNGSAWDAISPEYVARMKAQNRFKTGSGYCTIYRVNHA